MQAEVELNPLGSVPPSNSTENLAALQDWLRRFIDHEKIDIHAPLNDFKEDQVQFETVPNAVRVVDEVNTDFGRGTFSTVTVVSFSRVIHTVPELLKERSVDDFCPKAFPVGLQTLVSGFDASKLKFKFDVARAFSQCVYGDVPRLWEHLVTDIVGSEVDEIEQVTAMYENFRAWDLRAEEAPSASSTKDDIWHFGLLLAVDAVFVVVSLQAIYLRRGCDYCEAVRLLLKEQEGKILEFQKWDLILVENQVPLTLLMKVVTLKCKALQMRPECFQIQNPNYDSDAEFHTLIEVAVKLYHPFPTTDSDRRRYHDAVGCCCPCLADLRQRDFESQADDVQCFDWEGKYRRKFVPEIYTHLLECIYVVSSDWLEPNSNEPNLMENAAAGIGSVQGGQNGRISSRSLQPNASTRSDSATLSPETNTIPSASHLIGAGVHIRGVATSITPPSFTTINAWTILHSVICYSSLLACCFESLECCTSCISRWRATLHLPKVKMFIETRRIFRNLAVFEELANYRLQNPIASTQIRNYVKMMHCLVATEQDASLLAQSGVIQNCLASDDEVVQIWKFIDNGLVVVPLAGGWKMIYKNVQEHWKNAFKRWYAAFWMKNCSNPLVACSFLLFVALTTFSFIGAYLAIVGTLR